VTALLSEFSSELSRKQGKLDTDPHFWMPMTLERSAYIYLMGQKKVSEEISSAHFDRIQAMLNKSQLNVFGDNSIIQGLFGPCDVGNDICWWDYGQLKYYQKNAMILNEGYVSICLVFY
jgi:hypothetical protein